MKILIEQGKIGSIAEDEDSEILLNFQSSTLNFQLSFPDAIIFPGLINSHDHLDFNSFPQLGNRIYNNYVEWGEDIHRHNKDVIDSVLKIPEQLRIEWGIYKNLLNGITTVVNHGPKLTVENNLITVLQRSHSLHSVVNEKNWRYKLNMPFIKKELFTIHIGEGTDHAAEKEINTLIKWNLFNRELIGIHAVAMNEKKAAKFKAIVWCPDSNYFLLGRTTAIDILKHQTKILFGSDSTVSSNWNFWDHLRLARKEKMVTDIELLAMLTNVPANVWGVQNCGVIAKDYDADIVIARRKAGLKDTDAFFELNPEDILMVIHKGCLLYTSDAADE